MYIPTMVPTATITQVTSTITSIVTSTSDPSEQRPDIVKLCSGQIFCVIYLSARPFDWSNDLAFLKDSAQALVVALVSLVMVS
jgi:hypothetical protein